MPSALHFWFMAGTFVVRDALFPRDEVLREAGILPGWFVVDFGCGPGSYIEPLSAAVGPAGMVYAVDVDPVAVRFCQGKVQRKNLKNVCVARVEGPVPGTADGTVDAVLLYDVLHGVSEPGPVLREVHRMLKPGGILSVSDHHLNAPDLDRMLCGTGLFAKKIQGLKTCTFSKKV